MSKLTLKEIGELREKALECNLYAPCEYWDATEKEIKKVTGGCGPESSRWYLVPDTVYGLSIRPACNIHDYMYQVGILEEEKKFADLMFLDNMVKIINKATYLLRYVRKCRANEYYLAVKLKGDSSFYTKEKGNEIK